MKVKIVVINENQTGQYYKLMAQEGFILNYTPEWKTERGAFSWAKKHGFEVE